MPLDRQLPRYQCHKKVFALKIGKIEAVEHTCICGGLLPRPDCPAHGGNLKIKIEALITPQDEGYGVFEVTHEYLQKHKPKVGGYYVAYEDGYQSYSPAKAFEEGYTLIA